MIKIKIYPKNEKHFVKLKQFSKQILNICEKVKIEPIVWGGLAYFAYTKNNNFVINDIDFLVSDAEIKKLKQILKDKGIKYKYLSNWHSLIISKGDLQIEFDPIEWYCEISEDFSIFAFDTLKFKIINLKELIRMYKKASKVSKDKPNQHYQRYKELKKLIK